MGKKCLAMMLTVLWTLSAAAQQADDGLIVDRPTTITDVSPYQGKDVYLVKGGYYDEETFDYIYSMGSITLDAPAAPTWRINKFYMPINYWNYDELYDWETGKSKGRIYEIGAFLNNRTTVEAQEVETFFFDQQYEDWMFFSVPYDVNVSELHGGLGRWVIRRYDPEARAAARSGETWTDVGTGETLKAGEGYIFMRDYNGLWSDPTIDWDEMNETGLEYCLGLPAAPTENKHNLFRSGDVVLPLRHFPAKSSTNADWNMLGNPFACYYDVRAIPERAVLYVWDYNSGQYRTLSTEDQNEVVLAPGQPFFVQAGELSQLTFPASGRLIEGPIEFQEDWDDNDDWNFDDFDMTRADGNNANGNSVGPVPAWATPNQIRDMARAALSEAKAKMKAQQKARMEAREKMKVQRKAGGGDFNPQSPPDPGANYYNAMTGEAVFDMMQPNGLMQAAVQLLGDNDLYRNVRKVTVLTNIGEYFLFTLFTDCQTVDLSQAWGFEKVPAGAFSFMMNLYEVILPSCVREIDAMAFQYCPELKQIDLYSPIPPVITEELFTNMLNEADDMVIRVPAEAVEAYKRADVWRTKNIQALDGGGEQLAEVTLRVVAPDGTDLTPSCNILWTAEDGEVLGAGGTLQAQPLGSVVNYSIGLQPQIADLYDPVPPGTWTVKADGNVITISLEPTGVIDMGSRQLRGSAGTLEITFIPSDAEAPATFSPNDVKLTVTDPTTGSVLDDLVVQYPNVNFEHTILNPGQMIELTATSRTGSFAPATAQATADHDGTFAAQMELKEYGRAQIDCRLDIGVTGCMALIFDAAGRFIGRYNADGSIVRIGPLPDGDYRAAVMEQTPYLNAIATLEDLEQTSLVAGTDYEMLEIRLEAGTTGRYEADVHGLDVFQIGHITADTYVTTNDAELSITATGTVRSKVVFRPETAGQVTGVQLILDIPDGMEYVENSLICRAGSFQQTGRRFIVPYTAGEQVKLCLRPTRSGQMTIPAQVQYMLGGQKYLQPIGSATIQVTGLSLDVVRITNRADVTVRGYAFAGSGVTIYDGLNIVGKTIAKSDGFYSADITLNPAYDGTLHRLCADVVTPDQPDLRTEISTVLYDREASMLTHVSMVFQDQRVTWNELTGNLSPGYYNVVPDMSDIATFSARLDNAKPECILDPYFDVLASDGTRRTLDATWNEATQTYTATASYPDVFCTPAEVQFLYSYADSTAYSRQELFDAEVNTLVAAHNQLVEGVEKAVEVGDIVIDDEETLSIELIVGGEDRYLMTVRLEDYDQVWAQRNELERPIIRTIMGGDTVTTYFIINGEESTTVYYANDSRREAYSETLDTQSAAARARRISWGGVVGKVKGWLSPTPSNLLKLNEKIDQVNGKMDDANKVLEALHYIDEMQARYDEYNNDLSNRINTLQYFLMARCPDGKLRVNPELYQRFQEEIRRLDQQRKTFTLQMQSLILSYCNALENCGYKEIAKELAKFTAKYLAKQKLSVKSEKLANRLALTGDGTAEEFGGLLDNGIGGAIDFIVDIGTDLITKHGHISTDFVGVKRLFEDFVPKEYHKISMQVTDLKFTIQAAYKECKDKDIDRPPVPWAKIKRKVRPMVDPSGYVYEGVESNRLEGVTAVIYYKTEDGQGEQEWDAENYGQLNPQVTDAQGTYMWNVPQGMWHVRFQKDGYETTQTDWLPVPPPQLDVNVPMMSHAVPAVTDAEATPEAVSLHFSKFMDIASLAAMSIRQNGNTLTGTIEGVGAEKGLASHVRFVPAQPITASQVEVTVPDEAQSYAGDRMQGDYNEILPVHRTVESLIVEEGAAIELGKTGYIRVAAYPAQAVAGRTLRVTFRSPILEQGEADLTFDEEGQVEVPFRGLLPGKADVTFAIADMEAKAGVEVKYHLYDIVAKPIPNIADGTVVGEGSSVELYTATEGAVIYYTTDGTCPCDLAHSIRYDGPIPITGELCIQAIAVCEGMQESEVVTLHYTVGDGLAVNNMNADEIVLSQGYYDLNGKRVARPLRKGIYIQVSRTPYGLRTQKILIGN